MVDQYLVTALWSSTDENQEPLDSSYALADIAEESIDKAEQDCAAFISQAGSILDSLDLEDVGHDFWLTRNGHGAGFWDGDYEESVSKKLTELSHKFGEIDAYVGDDGKVYIG